MDRWRGDRQRVYKAVCVDHRECVCVSSVTNTSLKLSWFYRIRTEQLKKG